MTKSEEREKKAKVKAEKRAALIQEISNLKYRGFSNVMIADQLSISESTVRRLL